jgi:hypothetical protein
MRVALVTICLALSLLALPSSANKVQPREAANKRPSLDIRIQEGGWGNAPTTEIEALLQAVASELLPYFPGRELSPIVVSHSDETPIVLYEKGADDEYQMHLCATSTRWPQYAYEFAHELCHVLSNYERHVVPGMSRRHQWFEESLCEVASLYTLKRMTHTWLNAAPDPNWAGHGPSFGQFAQRFFAEPHRQLSPNARFPAWFEQHQRDLSRNPYLRQHNEVVANLMLPLFERHPQGWGALSYLNLDPKASTSNFHDYLRRWHNTVPQEQKSLVREIMALFGVTDSELEGSTIAAPSAVRMPGNIEIGPAGSTAQ